MYVIPTQHGWYSSLSIYTYTQNQTLNWDVLLLQWATTHVYFVSDDVYVSRSFEQMTETFFQAGQSHTREQKQCVLGYCRVYHFNYHSWSRDFLEPPIDLYRDKGSMIAAVKRWICWLNMNSPIVNFLGWYWWNWNKTQIHHDIVIIPSNEHVITFS